MSRPSSPAAHGATENQRPAPVPAAPNVDSSESSDVRLEERSPHSPLQAVPPDPRPTHYTGSGGDSQAATVSLTSVDPPSLPRQMALLWKAFCQSCSEAAGCGGRGGALLGALLEACGVYKRMEKLHHAMMFASRERFDIGSKGPFVDVSDDGMCATARRNEHKDFWVFGTNSFSSQQGVRRVTWRLLTENVWAWWFVGIIDARTVQEHTGPDGAMSFKGNAVYAPRVYGWGSSPFVYVDGKEIFGLNGYTRRSAIPFEGDGMKWEVKLALDCADGTLTLSYSLPPDEHARLPYRLEDLEDLDGPDAPRQEPGVDAAERAKDRHKAVSSTGPWVIDRLPVGGGEAYRLNVGLHNQRNTVRLLECSAEFFE